MSVKKAFYLLLAAGLAGCNYDIDEQYVNQLTPPSNEGTVITLPHEGDTLVLSEDPTTLRFDITTGKPVLATEVYFDNKLAHTLQPNAREFQLSIYQFRTGYYKLDLKVSTNPQTGSIANLEGSEITTTWRSYTVFVDKTLPTTSALTSIGPKDGTLYIQWTPNNDPNFQHYELRKYVQNAFTHIYQIHDTLIVTDQNQTFVTDPDFIGGSARYRLRVVARNRYSEQSEREYISSWNPDFHFTWQSATDAEFTWRKNPYYNNIASFVVAETKKPGETITDANDTTSIFSHPDFRFGKTVTIELKVTSKADPKNMLLINRTLHKGEPCNTNFYGARYNPFADRYYSLLQSSDSRIPDTLFTFLSDNKLTPFQKITLQNRAKEFALSRDGQLVYVLFETELVAMNAATLAVVKTYPFTLLPPTHRSAEYGKLLITQNNFAVIRFNPGDVVIDLSTFKIVFQHYGPIFSIAPDGSQLFVAADRYTWNGSTFVSTNQTFYYFPSDLQQFRQHTTDTLSLSTETYSRILNAQNGTVVKQINYAKGVASYEHNERMINIFRSNELERVNVQTGTKESVPLDNTNTFFSITNKNLICKKGFYMRLN